LKRGEGVFTQGQMKALAPAGAGMKVDVVVNNYSGANASTQEVLDSRGNRRIEVTIDEINAGGMSRPGSKSHQAIRNSFGARPALTRR
jgi:hypothetical protein